MYSLLIHVLDNMYWLAIVLGKHFQNLEYLGEGFEILGQIFTPAGRSGFKSRQRKKVFFFQYYHFVRFFLLRDYSCVCTIIVEIKKDNFTIIRIRASFIPVTWSSIIKCIEYLRQRPNAPDLLWIWPVC